MRFTLKLVLSASLLCVGSAANAVTLDFEAFSTGQIIDDEYTGVTINAINGISGPNAAVIFDTDNYTGGDTDLAASFSSPQNPGLIDNLEPGNVLIIQENNTCSAGFCSNPDDDAAGGVINIEFDNPVPLLQSIDFFDIEFHEDDGNGTVSLFDATNALLAVFDIPFTGGDNTWDRLVMDTEDVKRIEISLAGSGAIDNIQYVPIPAAVWLFGSGLIGLIGVSRRKKTT